LPCSHTSQYRLYNASVMFALSCSCSCEQHPIGQRGGWRQRRGTVQCKVKSWPLYRHIDRDHGLLSERRLPGLIRRQGTLEQWPSRILKSWSQRLIAVVSHTALSVVCALPPGWAERLKAARALWGGNTEAEKLRLGLVRCRGSGDRCFSLSPVPGLPLQALHSPAGASTVDPSQSLPPSGCSLWQVRPEVVHWNPRVIHLHGFLSVQVWPAEPRTPVL